MADMTLVSNGMGPGMERLFYRGGPSGAHLRVVARSAGFPACGFWGLSSPQFPVPGDPWNPELESSGNPQARKPTLRRSPFDKVRPAHNSEMRPVGYFLALPICQEWLSAQCPATGRLWAIAWLMYSLPSPTAVGRG